MKYSYGELRKLQEMIRQIVEDYDKFANSNYADGETPVREIDAENTLCSQLAKVSSMAKNVLYIKIIELCNYFQDYLESNIELSVEHRLTILVVKAQVLSSCLGELYYIETNKTLKYYINRTKQAMDNFTYNAYDLNTTDLSQYAKQVVEEVEGLIIALEAKRICYYCRFREEKFCNIRIEKERVDLYQTCDFWKHTLGNTTDRYKHITEDINKKYNTEIVDEES